MDNYSKTGGKLKREEAELIGKILGADKVSEEQDRYRIKVSNSEENRSLSLEIFPEIELGKTRGLLIVVYTGNSHLQLHNCSGYVVSEELGEVTEWGNINQIKEILGKGRRVAVAGGITPDRVNMALTNGADIIVVGRYIIGSRDVRRAAEDFLSHMPQDPDTMRLALDEDESI